MQGQFLKPFLADVKKFVLDTLFPITCIHCETEGNFVCANCKSAWTGVGFQKCIICRKPSPLGFTHPGCKSPHAPEGLVSFFDYHDKKVSRTIIAGKYHFLPGVFTELGLMAGEKIFAREYKTIFEIPPMPPSDTSLPTSSFSLVPIPLAKSRQRWRGFNQSEILCKALSDSLGLPVAQVLTRKKSTKTQKDLKREQRIENVAGAFAVSPSPFEERAGVRLQSQILNLKSKISNQSFILVDDVTTTGSTLLEAAKVLKRNGAGKVWCLTVAQD